MFLQRPMGTSLFYLRSPFILFDWAGTWISPCMSSFEVVKSNFQASESSGTGRKSRATVKIPILSSNPKFAVDTYSLEIDQVHNILCEHLSGRILFKTLLKAPNPFQAGAIKGPDYPFSSEVAFPSPSGSRYSVISGGEKVKKVGAWPGSQMRDLKNAWVLLTPGKSSN